MQQEGGSRTERRTSELRRHYNRNFTCEKSFSHAFGLAFGPFVHSFFFLFF